MKKLFIYVLICSAFYTYAQKDSNTINQNWKVIRNVTEEGKPITCKKSFDYDTVFLVQDENYVHLRIFATSISTQRKFLFIEQKLHKSMNILDAPHTFSAFGYSNNSKKSELTFSARYRVRSYQDYRTGVVLKFDTNGCIHFIYNIKDGYLHGNYYQFYSDSVLFCKGRYRNHAKSGFWKYYYNNGNLMMKGKYYPEVMAFDAELIAGKLVVKAYGKKNSFLRELSLNEFNDIIKLLNVDGSGCPTVIDYRNKEWVIYKRNSEVAQKKTYNKTPVEADWGFVKYCMTGLGDQ